MALVSELRAIVTADTGAAAAKLDALGAEVKKLGSTGSSNLQKFGNVAKTTGLLIGASALAAAGLSIKAALDHQKALALLNAQMAHARGMSYNAAQAFTAQAEALGRLHGISADETIQADTLLVRFRLTQRQITDLIPLIQDYSRAQGVDLVTASQKVGLAVLGNARALKAVGIEYKVQTTAQDAVKSRFAELLKAYEKDHKGQDGLIAEYKLHQKGLEAVALASAKTRDEMAGVGRITDLLRGKVGGAADQFAKGDAGKIDIMREKLRQTEVEVGQHLMPIFEKLLGVVNSAVGWFGKLSPATQTLIIKFGLLAGAAALVLPKLISIVSSLVAMGPYGLAAAGAIAALGYAMATNETFAKAWGYQLGVIAGNLAAVAGLLHTVTSGLSDANFAAYGGAKGKAVKGTYAPGKGPLGKGYASGTSSADPGWHPVGEHGPELVNFRGGEQVVPAGGGEFHLYLDGVELAYVLQRRGVLRGTRG